MSSLSQVTSYITNFQSLTISKKNLPLIAVSASLGLFLLMSPVKVLWMQTVLTQAQISFLIGWMFLAVVLLELPTGALADLIGKRYTVLSGFLIHAVALVVFATATSYMQFAIAVSLQALAEALKSGARDALVYDSLKQDGRQKEYRRVNSKIMTINQFSLVIATFCGGALGTLSLTMPFYLNAIVLLIAAALTMLIEEPQIDTMKFTLSNYIRQTTQGTKHLIRSNELIKLTLLYTLVGGIGWTFQRLLRDFILIYVGYQQLELGIITGILRLINIILLARVVRSRRFRKNSRDLLLLPAILFLSLTPAYLMSPLTSIPIVAGAMIAGTGRFVILGPYLQEQIASRYRATAVSVANLMVSLLLTCSLFLASVLLGYFTLPTVVTGYGIFSLLVIIPVAISVRRDYKARESKK